MYINTVEKFRMSCKIEWNDQHRISYYSKTKIKNKKQFTTNLHFYLFTKTCKKKTDHMKTNMARQQKSIYCYIHLDSILFRSA